VAPVLEAPKSAPRAPAVHEPAVGSPAVHSIERGRAISHALVRWYLESRRDLPWRRTRDPYAIWVSETMLQQTRVDVVVPYYERFLARFPTASALAAAPIDDVLGLWAGLGYYRRARQLHAAALAVVRDHAGRLPADETALRALPGIGRYTAGAILSIAFERPAAIVDGNVARVLSRLFALRGGPGESRWEKRLWALAGALVPADDPSSFNQGLMELGATVCTPHSPRCGDCPLARFCRARAAGRAEAYPPPKRRAPVVRVERWAIVLERSDDGARLVRRRGDDERNAGFWELPEIAAPDADVTDGGARTPRAHWARELRAAGIAARAIDAIEEIGAVRHSILSQAIRVRVFSARATGGTGAARSTRAMSDGWRWVTSAELAALPHTSISRKALAEIERVRREGHQLGFDLVPRGRADVRAAVGAATPRAPAAAPAPARTAARGGSTNKRR
jgi:A/G-specific adenine glycosylase